ncbi:MAG: glutathione S-transferase family protein [Gammaproteobacteria bacterium]|nr:glutathione S-transferase family protein [Gammaproteobacteria bacterium]
MKFYDCETAPSPRRVRIFMAEKDIAIPVVQVNLREGEQLGEEFRRLNPDCTVPVLQLDDDSTLTEVFAICQYLEECHPEPALLGRTAAERATVTMWNSKIEQHGLAAIAEAFRNKARGFSGRALTGASNFAQIPELAERGRMRSELFFDRMEALFATNEFVVGDYFSFADISALVAVDFAAWMKIGMHGREHLQRWHAAVSARPSASA